MNAAKGCLPVFQLAEWESLTIGGQVLTDADRRLQTELSRGEEGRLNVDELRTGVRVQARAWVGVVRFERFEIRIVPKLAGDNLGLVRMIEFAVGLDAIRRNSSARTLHAEGAGLFDLIALLLAESAEATIRGGLLADYVEREDDLPVLRGRLLHDRQMLRRFGRLDRLACRFEEHEQNIADNQLLAAAFERCAPRVVHEAVRRRVRRLLTIFEEVCRADDLDLEAVRGRIVYHRLNEHYRDPHQIAWLILDGLGTRDVFESGSARCFAFLIDMNRLFELFVFRALERLLGKSMRAHYQRADRSIIVNASTNQPYARVVPDVLIEGGTGRTSKRLAVDAKYKLYDERRLSSSDVYQTFLYSYAYGTGGSQPAALLFYPSSTGSPRSVRLRVRSAMTMASADIVALGVPIPGLLAELDKRETGPVSAVLLEAIKLGVEEVAAAGLPVGIDVASRHAASR